MNANTSQFNRYIKSDYENKGSNAYSVFESWMIYMGFHFKVLETFGGFYRIAVHEHFFAKVRRIHY